eukprot:gene14884-20016_t
MKICFLVNLILILISSSIEGEKIAKDIEQQQKFSYLRETVDNATARHLLGNKYCDESTSKNNEFKRYFMAMMNIYQNIQDGTCLPVHKQCGWPNVNNNHNNKKLPLLILSVGLEGAGHHLWTELMEQPLFDCVWKNGRHYNRDVADGVPRTTSQQLMEGFKEQFKLRADNGKSPCRTIYDSEDSFPTGAIRKSGRIFMRPDIVNLQQLDGVLFDVKYLIILRNTTDTALSALRRNFFTAVDPELRTVEHTLTYLESVLRMVSCHKIFIAHYEHVLADPMAYYEPLSTFLEFDNKKKELFKKRLSTRDNKIPSRKPHKLNQYAECKSIHDELECYEKITQMLDSFFNLRSFMWPTFAGNGFDYSKK